MNQPEIREMSSPPEKRPHIQTSPAVPSCVSMKSEQSMSYPPKFREMDPPPEEREDHHSDDAQRGCESCVEVPDTSHWVLVEPEVSTEKRISTYSLSSPAGSYECSESGLRWSCAGPVTLQYRYKDWYVFAKELAHMQCSPAGPLMDIKITSGELEEIHLPHFLCLGGVKAVHDAVRLLHGENSGVCVEKCEVTQRHARLLQPSSSLLGAVYHLRHLLSPKAHCELLLFYERYTASMKLRIYLVPNDKGHISNIHQQEKAWNGIHIKKPSTTPPLWTRDNFCVRTSCPSEIDHKELSLFPLSTGNFCDVYIQQPEQSFDVEITSTQHTEPIQKVTIREHYRPPSGSPGQHGTLGTRELHVDLFTTLDELQCEELKRFKAYLSEQTMEGFKPFPSGLPEEYDVTDVVCKMRDEYGKEDAVKITLTILRKMNLNDLADKLEEHMVTRKR